MDHDGHVFSVAFSLDGKYLATGCSDGTAALWDVANGTEVTRMNHDGSVFSVAFSPDGKYLATAGEDRTARLWEATNGQEVARMIHENPVGSVAFSPNGKYLATAGLENSTQVWFRWPEDMIAEACSRLTRNLTREEWRQYLGNEPYRRTYPNLPMPED